MGSIQQVTMATVCLAAAFAFGSFINQSPNQPSSQTDLPSPDRLRSLIEPEATVLQSPAQTPWMKPKLSARLPMPNLYNDDATSEQAVIPPPSDLAGRIGVPQNSLVTPLASPAQKTTDVANAPTFKSDVVGESSMPTVIKPHFGQSPILADSNRTHSQSDLNNEPLNVAANAPVFTATDFSTTEDLTTPPQNLNRPVHSHISSRPDLSNRSIRPIQPATQIAAPSTNVAAVEMPFDTVETNLRKRFKPDFNNHHNQNHRMPNGLMPIPQIKETVTIDDPGAAFGNRNSQPGWNQSHPSTTDNNDSNYYPEANREQSPQQHRVARLPFRLNSNAKSKLTRIRDNTIQKISLNTTQFSEYVVQSGDTLQSIANTHFGKPDFYLDIYLANRDRLRFPGDIRNGMTIKIPIYE